MKENKKQKNENTCICCGKPIPKGQIVCTQCESESNEKGGGEDA